jgi:hypothetical protein
MRPLTKDHPKIDQFLRLWHENGRAQFQHSMPSYNYDTQHRKIARDRRQYLLLNSGNDGVFLVQRSTQYVYQVDDYGRRGKFLNTLDALIEQYTVANERQEQTEPAMTMAGWTAKRKSRSFFVLCLLLSCICIPFGTPFAPSRKRWATMSTALKDCSATRGPSIGPNA